MKTIENGNKFNFLTIISFSGRGKGGHLLYNCKCDCGIDVVVAKSKLLTGHTKSCGCWNRRSTTIRNIKRKGIYRKNITEYAFRVIKSSLKGNANSRNLECILTDQEIGKLIDSKCFYCGGGFKNKITVPHRNETVYYNGIDRLDNSLGYTASNCVSCCFTCNRAKDTMNPNEFKTWISLVYKHLTRDRLS